MCSQRMGMPDDSSKARNLHRCVVYYSLDNILCSARKIRTSGVLLLVWNDLEGDVLLAGALIVVVAVCSFLAGFMYHRRRSGVSATSSQMVFLSDSGEDSFKESLDLLVDGSGKYIILGQGSFGKVRAFTSFIIKSS